MNNFKSRHLTISILFLLVSTATLYGFMFILTENHFAYGLGSPYIHMTMVKHIVAEGILSVDGETYASASSSPLWIIFLSPFYYILGAKLFVYISAILNILFQVMTLSVVCKIVGMVTGKKLHYLYLIFLILATPFLALTIGGTEHSLQIFLVILFIYYFLTYLREKNSEIKILLLAPFIMFVRYENFAFIIAISMILILYVRDWRFAVKLILSSLILVLFFAIWSIMLGIDPIPTSIAAKSTVGMSVGFIEKFTNNLLNPHILMLFILNLLVMISSYKKSKEIFYLSLIFLLTLVAHLAFAKLGRLYRYEAYLVIFGILNLMIYQHLFIKRKKISLITSIFILIILSKQILYSPIVALYSAKKVYEQKLQEAYFVTEYYSGEKITSDNIGSLPYYSDAKIFDIHGLTDLAIIKLKKEKRYTDDIKKKLIKEKCNQLIIAYSSRFEDDYIDGYTKIVDWTTYNRIFHDYDGVVSIYSRDDKIKESYRDIKEYSDTKLPKSVTVTWNSSLL